VPSSPPAASDGGGSRTTVSAHWPDDIGGLVDYQPLGDADDGLGEGGYREEWEAVRYGTGARSDPDCASLGDAAGADVEEEGEIYDRGFDLGSEGSEGRGYGQQGGSFTGTWLQQQREREQWEPRGAAGQRHGGASSTAAAAAAAGGAAAGGAAGGSWGATAPGLVLAASLQEELHSGVAGLTDTLAALQQLGGLTGLGEQLGGGSSRGGAGQDDAMMSQFGSLLDGATGSSSLADVKEKLKELKELEELEASAAALLHGHWLHEHGSGGGAWQQAGRQADQQAGGAAAAATQAYSAGLQGESQRMTGGDRQSLHSQQSPLQASQQYGLRQQQRDGVGARAAAGSTGGPGGLGGLGGMAGEAGMDLRPAWLNSPGKGAGEVAGDAPGPRQQGAQRARPHKRSMYADPAAAGAGMEESGGGAAAGGTRGSSVSGATVAPVGPLSAPLLPAMTLGASGSAAGGGAAAGGSCAGGGGARPSSGRSKLRSQSGRQDRS
jgi:hypothetical protein